MSAAVAQADRLMDSVRMARALLTRVCEPGDVAATMLIETLGPLRAVEVMFGSTPTGVELAEFHHVAAVAGQRKPQDALARGLERWRNRVNAADPVRDLASIAKLGGTLLIPEDEGWPPALADLGPEAPIALWVRGAGAIQGTLPLADRSLAVVGSRGATPYGGSATRTICEYAVSRGVTVISGGAYGIDAMAHRSALTVGSDQAWPTYAILACGVDRYYPAGNQQLLQDVMNRTLLVSETAPGGTPTRWRFLQRNRLIAALAGATVVVEATWRSGALNTASHAAGLGREIGAVPGPIDSPQSAGVHRLMREGGAIPITDGPEALELLGHSEVTAAPGRVAGEKTLVTDGMRVDDQLVYEALPKIKGSTISKLSEVSGVSEADVRAALGRLSLVGLAQQIQGMWRVVN